MITALITVAATVLIRCSGVQGQGAVQVTDLDSGHTFNGLTNNGVDSYLGIPYATISERFAVSEPILEYSPNSSTDATRFGPRCTQATLFGPPVAQSEDCLYLNIWTPSNASSQQRALPTMVWIHGGGYVSGSGAERLYDGSNLARDENVIVVTINYRLGILGFLALDETGRGGMNGHYDQINALEWVNNSIRSFGGDPDSVTIFGESIGGVSVCLLSVSPLASDLFQRAIIQSGQCITDRLAPLPPAEGYANTQALLNESGARSIQDLISNFSADELIQAGGMNFNTATMDGLVMPAHPLDLYRDASINPSDMLIGSTTMDDPAMLGFPPMLYIARAYDMEEYVHGLFDESYGVEASERVLQAYSAEDYYDGSNVTAYAQFAGDNLLRCAGRELAAIAAESLSDVGNAYLYVFEQNTDNDLGSMNGLFENAGIDNATGWASHTSEVPFMFGNLDWTYIGPAPFPPTEEQVNLSNEMTSRWAAFARSGIPVSAGVSPNWTSVPNNIPMDEEGASDVPVLCFKASGSEMSNVPFKRQQCSVIPGIPDLRASSEESDPLTTNNSSPTPIPTAATTEAPTLNVTEEVRSSNVTAEPVPAPVSPEDQYTNIWSDPKTIGSLAALFSFLIFIAIACYLDNRKSAD